MQWWMWPGWKWVGVAAFAGVAATGVVLARQERRQRPYTPEEIRDRLHTRAAEAFAAPPASETAGASDGSEPST